MRALVSTVVGVATAIATVVILSSPAPAVGAPIIVIFMENHERSSIESSPDADYLKAFERAGRSFTHYYGVSHPSLPNYLAFGNGSTNGKAGSDSTQFAELRGKTLWSELQTNGISWGVYMESMPSACYNGSSSGQYVLRHNPALPFRSVAAYPKRCAKVKPFSQFSTSNLPAVSFIAPNLCNDMHDCSIATGDNWLAAHVPAMLNAGAEVIITFDEGSTGDHGGGNIYCAVRGPGIGSSTNTNTYNHYGLLAAIEKREGVPLLNNAINAAALPI